MSRKVIIDTDPGIDDAMAILLAFAVRGLSLMGSLIGFGLSQILSALHQNSQSQESSK